MPTSWVIYPKTHKKCFSSRHTQKFLHNWGRGITSRIVFPIQTIKPHRCKTESWLPSVRTFLVEYCCRHQSPKCSSAMTYFFLPLLHSVWGLVWGKIPLPCGTVRHQHLQTYTDLTEGTSESRYPCGSQRACQFLKRMFKIFLGHLLTKGPHYLIDIPTRVSRNVRRADPKGNDLLLEKKRTEVPLLWT